MTNEFYDEDIHSKPLSMLRSPAFNQGLAQFLVDRDLSGDMTMDWLCDENYYHHRGGKFDWKGVRLDIDDLHIEELFGEEPRRYINLYKCRAKKPGVAALRRSCQMRVMVMYFARVSYCARHGIAL